MPQEAKIAYVIACEELGIYLGYSFGITYWSKVTPGGQPAAVTFPTIGAAAEHVKSWTTNNNPKAYRFVQCSETTDGFVDIAGLKAAGLGKLLGDMERSAKEFSVRAALAAEPKKNLIF